MQQPLLQGEASEAEFTYATLQQIYSNDPYGQPYVEMATKFWEAYQSTHLMYYGCSAAIQYSAEQPELFVPLGSEHYGAQSHPYVPEDVCPFRYLSPV